MLNKILPNSSVSSYQADKSAITIQRCFRGHKLSVIEKRDSISQKDHVEINHPEDPENFKYIITFNEKRINGAFKISKMQLLNLADEGSSKFMLEKNDTTVGLCIKKHEEFDDERKEKNIKKYHILKQYSCIAANFYCGKKNELYYVLSINAGRPICNDEDGIKSVASVLTKQFKDIVEQIDKIHDAGIRLIDIKPMNMAVKQQIKFDGLPPNQVKLIDTDDAYVPGIKCSLAFTREFIIPKVKEMLCSKEDNPFSDEELELLKQQDYYGLLTSMIIGTAKIPDKDLRQLVRYGETGRNLVNMKGTYGQSWIDRYIIPDYRNVVNLFLTDPNNNLLTEPLSKMIDWSIE